MNRSHVGRVQRRARPRPALDRRAPRGTVATFADVPDLFDDDVSRGWALASTATDLDGDLLPELYLANDFGPDRLLHNRSTPGRIRLALVEGEGSRLTVPKSKMLGHDSFKGMGVDFGDLDGDGLYDMYVSNITTSFGIQESNFAFVNQARDTDDLRQRLADGRAPFVDRSAAAQPRLERLGLGRQDRRLRQQRPARHRADQPASSRAR